MRKLIVDEWMTLDGVIQGPTSPDEDRPVASSAEAGTRSTSTRSR